MAQITKTYYLQAQADNASYRGNDGFVSSPGTNWFWVGSHLNSSYRGYVGYRWLMPGDIDPNTIVDARFVGFVNGSAGATVNIKTLIRVEQSHAPAWSASGSNRPDNRWNSVGSGNEIYWDGSVTAVTTPNESPNLAVHVKSAMQNLSPGNDYLGIIMGPQTNPNSNDQVQMIHPRHPNSSFHPYLKITVELEPQSASVTAAAPSIGVGAGNDVTILQYTIYERSYHDGIGDSTRRDIDLIVPQGTPPAGGWPTVFFVHGGAWAGGSKNDVYGASRWMRDTLSKGFAITSINYKFTKGEFSIIPSVNRAVGYTMPDIIADGLAALKWVKDNAATYNINANRLIGAGYSAGGHIISFLAVAVQDPTPDAYNLTFRGQSTTKGMRYPNYPNNRVSEGRTGFPKLRGVFSFGGPWSISDLMNHNVLIHAVLSPAWGAGPADGPPGGRNKEGDVDSYLTGETGTIYAGRSPVVPDFPIAFSHATGDITAPTVSTYTAAYNALNEIGYDVSQASKNGVVATGAALSQHGYVDNYFNAGGHDGLMLTYSSAFYTNFLDEAMRVADENDAKQKPKWSIIQAGAEVPLSWVGVVKDSSLNEDEPFGVEVVE